MPTIPLKVDYQGGAAEQKLRGLQSIAGGVGKAMAAIGVGLAAGAIVKDLADMYKGFEKDEAAAVKLARTLARVGGSRSDLASATAALSRATRKLGIDEEVSTAAMSRLIVKTGNAKTAIANFGLVEDLAAQLGTDLSSSADMVSKALTGQFVTLGRALPLLKNWIAAHKDLVGTQQGAIEFTAQLTKMVAGEAEAASSSSVGQMKRLKNLYSEMRDEVGRMLTGSQDTAGAWKESADSAETFLHTLQQIQGLPIIQRALGVAGFYAKAAIPVLQSTAGDFSGLDELYKSSRDAQLEKRRRANAPDPRYSYNSDMYGTPMMDDLFGLDQRPSVFGDIVPMEKKKNRRKRPSPYTGADWSGPEQLPVFDYNSSLDLNYDETMPPRTGLPSTGRFADAGQMHANAIQSELKKKKAVYDAFVKDMTSVTQNAFSAMFSNLGNGFDAMMKSWVRSFESSLMDMASKKAASWLMGMIGLGPVGAVAGGYTGPATGIGPFVTLDKSYGQPQAVKANLARRAGRM
jgi:hypothetical protein